MNGNDDTQQKLPSHIRIGGIDYQVHEVKDLRDGSQGLNGWIRINECQIRIEAEMSDQQKWVTAWHEVVHGLLEQAGFQDQDEQMIAALGYGIVQVLRDNPYLRGET